ncbi:MAG TPA: TIGR01620 family protein [Methylocystis sp.]|nr:TIGR01620 family protein [Methylocystis sp.]
MTNADRRPRPRAFRLDGDTVIPPRTQQQAQPFAAEVVEPEKDPFGSATLSPDAEERAVEAAQIDGLLQRFLLSWGGVFWSALGGLVSLALTMWVTGLVENLFAHSALLGTIGLSLAVALAVAAVFLLAREWRAMMRQNRIARLHIALAQARSEDDGKAARARLVELCRLYEQRVETAKARARVLELSKEIIDGRDLIDLAERTLVLPLDERVTREIAAASKRVSVVTTVSPRALLDVIFVAGQAIWLMRRIAEIYGGRPGLFGFFKLARSVGAHLTITGGLAIGDSLLQQLVGHGIAAKLSARLGEGVLNGLLTARVGLSAMAVCRPMPFAAEKQPGVKEVAPFLFGDKSK